MAYAVKTDTFEGPFDLLLYLVSRQRVDIASISLAEITDQYLAEISRMKHLDLDVASDFLLVASTLLELKALSLIPHTSDEPVDERIEELSPDEARRLLIDKLITYKMYKNASAELDARRELSARMHSRTAGPDEDLLGGIPDYVSGISAQKLAYIAASVLGKREYSLLDREHIAKSPIPVEIYVRSIASRIARAHRLTLRDLLKSDDPVEIKVVTFLAVLEMYKQGMIDAQQQELFGDIEIIQKDVPKERDHA